MSETAALAALLTEQNRTDVTKLIHRKPYTTISSSRPELSQAGKTVLITGGGGTIGLSFATHFIRAKVSMVIITGRRQEILDAAVKNLQAEAKEVGTSAVIKAVVNDQTDRAAVRAMWADFRSQGIFVDTLISNAGDFSGFKSILECGADRIWQAFEVNVRGPLDMVEGFSKQPGDKPKAVLNIATQGINMLYPEQLVVTAQNPGYPLTKNSGTLLMQLIAKDADPEQMQVVSFHPGVIYSDAFKSLGFGEDEFPFDHIDLPGCYAVWAASPEARFLHGRFTWASWDVDELATGELRKRIDENVDFLRVGVTGLKGARLN